ncbi:hypothetical protein MASR2M78_16150 [Treponema sp.]
MGGASKTELLAYMRTVDAIWMKDKKASRAIDMDFAKRKNAAAVFPVPSMRVIQDHGSVEIMRGCPNGCRFCHAGLWYRPMRQKPIETIKQEVQTFIEQGGYREITLSSLSTGDYQGIDTLISELSQTYSDRNISFQLPSLKVSSFSLPLIDSISKVRKSGLTFAIETPLDAWQLAINKEVCRSDIISILKEAKYKGYKSAKFYFMIGLPLPPIEGKKEEDEIIDFLFSIAREVKIQINVNIGTFIPKPHTSYQWAAQLSEEEASEKLRYIRDAFRRSAFKISTHDSFVSMLEGVISRGDEETAEIIEEAFLAGCRLDAWDEYIHKEAWKKALSNHSKAVSRALGPRETESPLPWDDIDSGISKNYLKREYKRSLNSSLTQACEENCTQNCGVCHDDLAVVKNTIQDKKALDEGITVLAQAVPVSPTALSLPENKPVLRDIHAPTKRLVFSFTKQGNAAFIPHLGVMEVFSRAFIRCNLGVRYTEGFNPLPRMDFAAPLSLGIMAQAEIATIDIEEGVLFSDFKRNMNTCLPAGFSIIEGFAFSIPEGTKKVSAASILWGFTYTQDDISIEVPAKEEKAFRLNSQVNGKLPLGLLRASVLARSETNPSGHQSYFEAYKNLYGSDEPC